MEPVKPDRPGRYIPIYPPGLVPPKLCRCSSPLKHEDTDIKGDVSSSWDFKLNFDRPY